MLRKIVSLILLLLFSACASTPVAKNSLVKPKPFVTPYEYYRHARPAIYTDQDAAPIQKAEVQTIGEDTKEEKSHAALIGALVGVAVVGGTVAGIFLLK